MLGSLFDFAKDIGKKLFTSDAEAAMNILQHIEANNPGVKPIDVKFDDGVVTLSGVAESLAAKEKAVLMAGNVEGVVKVNADDVEVDTKAVDVAQAEQIQYYTIQPGDTLSGIAKEFYGNAMKYPEIFEANREVIEDPDKIYPGQKIRIPALD